MEETKMEGKNIDEAVTKAKIAEQAERYEDMAKVRLSPS